MLIVTKIQILIARYIIKENQKEEPPWNKDGLSRDQQSFNLALNESSKDAVTTKSESAFQGFTERTEKVDARKVVQIHVLKIGQE